MFTRVSLRGMLSLIRVDTLQRVHNVGFIAGRLNVSKTMHCTYRNPPWSHCTVQELEYFISDSNPVRGCYVSLYNIIAKY